MKSKQAWVHWIDEQDATGKLAEVYEAVGGPDGKVENLYKAMSLTPEVIKPADDHYLAVLHNPSSPLAPWLAELIATYVSILCGSRYAAVNHGENFEHFFGDRSKSSAVLTALKVGGPESADLLPNAKAALVFTKKLSLSPQDITKRDIDLLRSAGFDDVAISFIAQIAASFAYWARITIALGIPPGNKIGLTNAPFTD